MSLSIIFHAPYTVNELNWTKGKNGRALYQLKSTTTQKENRVDECGHSNQFWLCMQHAVCNRQYTSNEVLRFCLLIFYRVVLLVYVCLLRKLYFKCLLRYFYRNSLYKRLSENFCIVHFIVAMVHGYRKWNEHIKTEIRRWYSVCDMI